MKKLTVICIIAIVVTVPAFAQWEMVRQGDELLANFNFRAWGDGFMLDADTGWLVGRDGLVIKTVDGGVHWQTVREADQSGVDWNDVEFIDANTGYACADDGFIFKTVDGGANWTMVGDTALYKEDLLFLKVIDANTVFFAGKKATLLKTSNGAIDFVKSDHPFEGLDLDGGLNFCNANVGVVASDDYNGYTWYTHDGGITWNLTRINDLFPYGISKYSVRCVGTGGDSTIVLGTQYRVILISQDGGKTYTQRGDYTFAMDYYWTLSVIDESSWYLGGDGLTVKTTDGGASWDTLQTGTGHTVMFMNFFDADNGFIFTEFNQWLKTTDGGSSFTALLDWPNLYFRGIGTTNNTIVVTAFGGGEITSSNDGGENWTYPTNLSTGVVGNLLKCEFFDDNNGIIVGQDGALLRTTDGGANWKFVENPLYTMVKSFYALAYYSADTLFAGGQSGYLVRSVNGGLTWSDTHLSATKSIYGILPLNGTTVIACGQSGCLYKADFLDNDMLEDSLYTTGTDDDFNAVVGYEDSLMLVSDEGNIFKASLDNLGSLTRIVVDPDTDELNDIEFINDTLVYVVGNKGKIYRSEDIGNTWTAEEGVTTATIYDIIYVNYALWGVADNGQIIKRQFEKPAEPVTGIVINEFLASNDSCCTDEGGDYDDYIELYNLGDEAVDIGGLYITDDFDEPIAWQIPDTDPALTTIQPGGFLVLWADKEPEEGVLHVDIKLSADGEEIGLIQIIGNDTTFVDSLSFGAQTTDIAHGRYEDGSNNWIAMDPTPGQVNASGVSAIDYAAAGIPTRYALYQNYPNPFNPVTNIRFDIPKEGYVSLTIYDMIGRQVAVLKNEAMRAGTYNFQLDASHLSSGVYFIRLQAGHFTALQKMMLMK